MKQGLRILAWFAFWFFVSCGGGGKPPIQPPPTPKEKFSLSGVVLNENEEPIAGAQVQLSLLSTITDEEGRFSFENLAGGNYNLSIQAPDGTFLSQLLSINSDISDAEFTLTRNPAGFAVIEVSPRLNAIQVPLDTTIQLTFSREVDPSSQQGAVTISPEVGELQVESQQNTMVISPTFELSQSQRYRISVSRKLRDFSGQVLTADAVSYFTTANVDNVPPRVVKSSPVQDAIDVFRNAEIILSFSDLLDESQDKADLQITCEPEFAFEILIRERTLRIVPEEALEANTSYLLHVSSVKDDAGNASEEFTLSFTTGSTIALFDDIEPDWTRFGNLIVFSRKAEGNYDLYTLELASKAINRLTDTPHDERHPRFSSDGSYIVYQANKDGNWDIFSYEASSQKSFQLTFASEDEIQPDFSNTFSQIIAFVKVRGFNLPDKIFTMNRDGSLQLEADPSFFRNEFEPTFHPLLDNQLLFVTDEGADFDIYVKSGFLSQETPINSNLTSLLTSDETLASYSPDGSMIAILSNFGGKKNIWLIDPTGTTRRQVTNFEEDVHSFAFSPVPGEDLLVVSLGVPGNHRLVLVSIATGAIIEELT